MKTIFNTALLTMITLAAAASYARGNPEAGKAIAEKACQACHGVDGNGSDPQYPRLAGQHADYMEYVLKGYRSGARPNPIMAGFAAGLSDQDIKDVAAWFANQSGLSTPE
jgi:cytochrome c553